MSIEEVLRIAASEAPYERRSPDGRRSASFAPEPSGRLFEERSPPSDHGYRRPSKEQLPSPPRKDQMPLPTAIGALLARRGRLLSSLMLATATVAALAALPTAGAGAAGAPQVSVPPAAQVEEVLGQTPVGSLPTGELTEKLSELPGLEGIEPATLEKVVKEVIEALTGNGATLEQLLGSEGAEELQEKLTEALGPLAGKLEELLGGTPLTKLEEALEGTPVGELISKLLSGSSEPKALIEQILSGINPEALQSLLGSVLSGAPVETSTLEQLAAQLGTTVTALAGEFGKTAEQLPGTTAALLAPLANGEKLGIVNSGQGLTLGLIKSATETVGGTGGNGAPGSPGTPGASGSGTTPGAPAPAPAPAPAAGKAAATGKLKVLRHSFKGHRATIVVQVPAAGVLTLSGKRLHAVRHETAKAERVTLHPSLTRAGAASVRKSHHHGLKVPIKVSFKPVSGASSSATVPLTYR
jgi:hypothetical protein